MKPGQVLYKIKEALRLDPETMLKIYALEEYPIDEKRLKAILKKPSAKGHENASYEELGVFLDGLIRLRRGEIKSPPPEDAEIELDNNLILKKLRIALELKDPDMEVIFELGERPLSRSKLRDLFRSPQHPKYLLCSDAMLNDFLLGLEEFWADMPPVA
ncbi:DUF1456 family protein [Nitratifractor salsuginis]|uniref:DUF1456 domain-containing protein n=1 Tax=Nitratifractor salsuginis (strain DSM 16511 / JCM 12458 / E9I37-1) TaxID=749222 RepID=E6X055_NITSE|nr:DUF1456 family protein [Nitratifractor salsuginis]ADV46778.1 protein of unknown function DUF1456 [Nitratifractor salsuginis DSM 16511]